MTRCQSDRRILPELDLLRQILSYDPATGYITYLDRPNDMFSSDRAANSWRTQYLGERAGSNITRDGRTYCQIELFNVKYNAHRLAWKIYYGEDPPDIIDHVDGDGSNNKIENLLELICPKPDACHDADAKQERLPEFVGYIPVQQFQTEITNHREKSSPR